MIMYASPDVPSYVTMRMTRGGAMGFTFRIRVDDVGVIAVHLKRKNSVLQGKEKPAQLRDFGVLVLVRHVAPNASKKRIGARYESNDSGASNVGGAVTRIGGTAVNPNLPCDG